MAISIDEKAIETKRPMYLEVDFDLKSLDEKMREIIDLRQKLGYAIHEFSGLTAAVVKVVVKE